MINRSKIILILVLSIFLFSGCLDERVESIRTLQSTKKIKISLKKTDTKVFDIKLKEQDKALILTFFTTSCGSCKKEIPSLNQINKEFSSKVQILSVLGEKISKKSAEAFIKQHDITYQIVSDPMSVSLLSKAVGGIFGVPITLIFNKQGKLTKKFMGYTPHKTMRDALLQAIN